MGKYSDFDLDLNQVKISEAGVSFRTTGDLCIELSKSMLKSCIGTCDDGPSCNCSASDMTVCRDGGKAGLLRC